MDRWRDASEGEGPRCQIGGVTDDGLFLRRALPDKITDHDDPGGDADADPEIFVRPLGRSCAKSKEREPKAEAP